MVFVSVSISPSKNGRAGLRPPAAFSPATIRARSGSKALPGLPSSARRHPGRPVLPALLGERRVEAEVVPEAGGELGDDGRRQRPPALGGQQLQGGGGAPLFAAGGHAGASSPRPCRSAAPRAPIVQGARGLLQARRCAPRRPVGGLGDQGSPAAEEAAVLVGPVAGRGHRAAALRARTSGPSSASQDCQSPISSRSAVSSNSVEVKLVPSASGPVAAR